MKVPGRGRITIPKRLRDQFGMHHNVEVEISPTERGLLIRKRVDVEHPVDRVYGILDRIEHTGIPIDNVDKYIEEIRGR